MRFTLTTLFILTARLSAVPDSVETNQGGWGGNRHVIVADGTGTLVKSVPAEFTNLGDLIAPSVSGNDGLYAGIQAGTDGSVYFWNESNSYYTRIRTTAPEINTDIWLPPWGGMLVTTDGSGSILGGTSVVGGSATNALNLVSDWNTAGAPGMIYMEVNDTASNASSRFISAVKDFIEVFAVDKAGNLASSGAVCSKSPSSGVGYTTGAGGSVTQITSITTGVTLNKVCGTVTTVSSTLGAGATATFSLTNSAITATDVVNASIKTYSGTGLPVAHVTQTGSGTCSLTLQNIGGSALNSTVAINFAVMKSVSN